MASNPRAQFSRLANLLERHEREKTANVEKATRNLDPVTRENIMEAARRDAEHVVGMVKRQAAGILASAINRVGREVRTFPRQTWRLEPEDNIPMRPGMELVQAVRLEAAKQHYGELIAEADRIVKSFSRKANPTNDN